jgi:transcriptional regulator with XRE-family HTH domain
MNIDYDIFSSVARPGETLASLGRWIRLLRQRRNWTLPMLAKKSGVPVSSISRFERTGLISTSGMMRILQALGELDGLAAVVRERIRLASIPRDLADVAGERPCERRRVRPVRVAEGSP